MYSIYNSNLILRMLTKDIIFNQRRNVFTDIIFIVITLLVDLVSGFVNIVDIESSIMSRLN